MDTAARSNGSARNSSVDQRVFFESDAALPLEPAELRVLIPVILGVSCVLGLSVNITAIGVLISNARKVKLSLINALLLNLLLADGLVLALVVPSKAAVLSRVSWPLGWFACKTHEWLSQTCLTAKSVTLAVMSCACHRYVNNPSRASGSRPVGLALLLAWLWLSVGCLSLPSALFSGLSAGREGSVCVQRVPASDRRAMWVYTHAFPLLAYCCPLTFALGLLGCSFRQSRRRGNKSPNLRTQIRSRKLALTLLGLAVTMATLWLPQWLWWAWGRRHGVGRLGRGRDLWLASELLPLSASLVDPVLVLALSEEFRHGYQSLWRRLTLRQAPPPAKPKPSPHTPTAHTSPRPRPETSLPPAGSHTLSDTQIHTQTPPLDSSPADGVLPDVEQFWHERENTSHTDNNDPVPWEHN